MAGGERWRDIGDGWPYQASNLGRVRRHPDHLHGFSNPDGVLKQFMGSTGYFTVRLSCRNVQRVAKVATLVLRAFRGPRPSRLHVAGHRNGVKTDNALANLGWITYRLNEADKTRHGTAVRGSRHPGSKLTEAGVRRIKRRLAAGRDTQAALAREFGVTPGVIWFISAGRKWRHVT